MTRWTGNQNDARGRRAVTGLSGDAPGQGLQKDAQGRDAMRVRPPFTFDEGGGLVLFARPPLVAKDALRLDFETPLVLRKDKLALKPADPVANLATGATLPQTVTKFNELLQALRDAGFLQT